LEAERNIHLIWRRRRSSVNTRIVTTLRTG
jgi:hypothetical protein